VFIVTPEGVIATDPIAYGKPTGGADYVAAIRAVTDKPIKYLIYSHHHYDHIAGGKAFKDAGATIIAHRRAGERLAVLKDPATPLPDELVGDKGTVLRLGGKIVELSYVGENHSDSTLVLRLPQDRIIFLVDLVPVGAFPGLGMIDFFPLEAIDGLKKIAAMEWDRMIPWPSGRAGRSLRHEEGRRGADRPAAARFGRGAGAGARRQVLEPGGSRTAVRPLQGHAQLRERPGLCRAPLLRPVGPRHVGLEGKDAAPQVNDGGRGSPPELPWGRV
jgi:hypothetical protein